jgi:hypothetical protein
MRENRERSTKPREIGQVLPQIQDRAAAEPSNPATSKYQSARKKSRRVYTLGHAAKMEVRAYTLFVFLVAQCLSAAPPPQNLLGRWRSIETSKGGIGSMLTFHSNGVVDFSPGAVVEMTYRIEGSQLILPPATNTGPELRQQMEFGGANQLRLITKVDGHVATLNLTRKGAVADAANPILGEWVGNQEMEGQRMEAHYFFYPAGRALFLLPFLTKPGHFTIRGTNMHLELPNHPPAEGEFRVEGDVLSTPSPSGSGYRFTRY